MAGRVMPDLAFTHGRTMSALSADGGYHMLGATVNSN